jgi:hypothetical protein
MTGRIEGSTACKARGYRFAEEIEKLFLGKSSRLSRAEDLGVTESALRRWESGSNIDNRMLGSLMLRDVNVLYILTGKRSAPVTKTGAEEPDVQTSTADSAQSVGSATQVKMQTPPSGCPNHGVCLRVPRLLELLGAFVGASATEADADKRAQIDRRLDRAIEVLQGLFRAG